MGILREIFGPSKREIWQNLSNQIGADFVTGGLFLSDKVVAKVREWTVTLDTYTVSNGKSSTTYTRIRAPYINKDDFRFTIYRSGFFSDIGKLFGMQDIEVGFAGFDEEYIIKGNAEEKVRTLFLNDNLRKLIQLQPDIHLEVKDDEGWFGEYFPEGVDELYFRVYGVIKDIDQLKSLSHLIRYLVKMFHDPEINTQGAQLIFTTHDTNLLNLTIFRRDQIWFTEKNPEYGNTDLYSLDEFPVRKNESIEKGYLQGRYGAIPFLGEGNGLCGK